ncbi:hypothetical protein TPENAI_20282 [Tenacibaculum litopenaei]|uniref:hypothetical protein n=1 Tax=Tenacibaculum litopenaei TaxID=396016 RepID=UPI0038948B90
MLRKNDFKEILQEKLNIALFDNSDFNERKALSSVENFYTEFGFNIPPKHFIYENANEVIQKFNHWSSKEFTAVNSWDWQFPMTSPGFWMLYMIESRFHLAHKRSLGPNKSNLQILFEGTNDVSKELLKEMWTEYKKLLELQPLFNLLDSEIDELYDASHIEDYFDSLLEETSQESSSEVFFIGTDFKLVYEIAVFEYLVKFHDIKRNSNYINCLNSILKHCGLVISFKECYIICKKRNYHQQRV